MRESSMNEKKAYVLHIPRKKKQKMTRREKSLDKFIRQSRSAVKRVDAFGDLLAKEVKRLRRGLVHSFRVVINEYNVHIK